MKISMKLCNRNIIIFGFLIPCPVSNVNFVNLYSNNVLVLSKFCQHFLTTKPSQCNSMQKLLVDMGFHFFSSICLIPTFSLAAFEIEIDSGKEHVFANRMTLHLCGGNSLGNHTWNCLADSLGLWFL